MLETISTFRNSFLSRLRKPTILGLDLGQGGVKVVRLEDRKEGKSVTRHFFRGRVSESDPLSITRFRNFLKSRGLAGMLVACNLDDPSLKVRRLDMPKMPDYDLREAVKWQLRDIAEESIDLYTIRYTVLDEYQAGEAHRLALMVFAVRREVIRGLMSLLKKVLLKPALIEPTSIALLSVLDRVLTWERGVTYGVLDLGESQSGFHAVSEGKLLFSRPLVDISGHKLSQMMIEELSLGEKDIQSLKEGLFEVRESLDQVSEERLRVIRVLLPLFFSKTAIEAQRSLDALSIMYHRGKVDRVYLCGGLSALPGLREYLTKNVGIQMEILNPFEGWSVAGDSSHLYSAAVGLALYHP